VLTNKEILLKTST